MNLVDFLVNIQTLSHRWMVDRHNPKFSVDTYWAMTKCAKQLRAIVKEFKEKNQ